jgi:hypothetical protein
MKVKWIFFLSFLYSGCVVFGPERETVKNAAKKCDEPIFIEASYSNNLGKSKLISSVDQLSFSNVLGNGDGINIFAAKDYHFDENVDAHAEELLLRYLKKLSTSLNCPLTANNQFKSKNKIVINLNLDPLPNSPLSPYDYLSFATLSIVPIKYVSAESVVGEISVGKSSKKFDHISTATTWFGPLTPLAWPFSTNIPVKYLDNLSANVADDFFLLTDK